MHGIQGYKISNNRFGRKDKEWECVWVCNCTVLYSGCPLC